MSPSRTDDRRSEEILLPFLKWAGGKRWLTSQYAHLFPKQFNTYIEPFLGSAAVLFHLKPDNSIVADKNPDLINTYIQLRDNWSTITLRLADYQRRHSNEFYYEERSKIHACEIERAAQFLYLNRTCWNGLYRVNLKGVFNVPIGTKTKVLLPSDDFEATARILSSCEIVCQDFELTIGRAKDGDFVFVDPPYVTRHNLNGFVKYNRQIFSWDDQIRLQKCIASAAGRGAKILVTNADHATIRELYAEIGTSVQMHRQSILASNSSNRGPTTELAVLINA